VIPSQILERARALMRGRKRELAAFPLHNYLNQSSALKPAQQSQDNDDDEDEADNPGRPVSPSSAVAPCRYDAE
jgi:hypothetical protein